MNLAQMVMKIPITKKAKIILTILIFLLKNVLFDIFTISISIVLLLYYDQFRSLQLMEFFFNFLLIFPIAMLWVFIFPIVQI
jgi:hypothetical protein